MIIDYLPISLRSSKTISDSLTNSIRGALRLFLYLRSNDFDESSKEQFDLLVDLLCARLEMNVFIEVPKPRCYSIKHYLSKL